MQIQRSDKSKMIKSITKSMKQEEHKNKEQRVWNENKTQ